MNLEQFLSMFVQEAHLKLKFEVESHDELLRANFSGEDAPIILARNADALNALEYLCNRIFEKIGKRIQLDCNGFHEARAEELRLMALTAAESVKRLGRPFKLNPMSPEERRIVHLTIADDSTIRTESEGYGENRQVVIYPR